MDSENKVYIIGTGPSLKNFDFNLLKDKNTCTLNDAIYFVPNPKMAVFYDPQWFDEQKPFLNYRYYAKLFTCNFYTFDRTPRHESKFPVIYYKIGGTNGICRKPGHVNTGNNVCHLAINICIEQGYKEIILIGIDMTYDKKRYFYGHGKGTPGDYHMQIANFEQIHRELLPGERIINANEQSIIKCFPIINREKAIYGQY